MRYTVERACQCQIYIQKAVISLPYVRNLMEAAKTKERIASL